LSLGTVLRVSNKVFNLVADKSIKACSIGISFNKVLVESQNPALSSFTDKNVNLYLLLVLDNNHTSGFKDFLSLIACR
jgi:hypothetical protein